MLTNILNLPQYRVLRVEEFDHEYHHRRVSGHD